MRHQQFVHVGSGSQAVVAAEVGGGRGRGGGMSRRPDEPHAKRRGQLKNGNPSGDFSRVTRCGARTRHGGPDGNPRCPTAVVGCTAGKVPARATTAGLERSRRARRHVVYSQELRQLLADNRRQWRAMWALLDPS